MYEQGKTDLEDVKWLHIEGLCYGIINIESPQQEATTTCPSIMNSTLAVLKPQGDGVGLLQLIDDTLYGKATHVLNKYWVSGKCKCDMKIVHY